MREGRDHQPADEQGAMRPAIALAVATLVIGFVLAHPQNAVGEVGVVFPPWASQTQIHNAIIAAGGQVAGPSRLANVFVAYAPGPGFHDAIRAQGAWFAVSATGLCAPIIDTASSRSAI